MIPATRLAQLSDMHSLVDIDIKGYDYPWPLERWRDLTEDPTCVIMLAILQVEPVGACVWQKKPAVKEGEILRLTTKPAYRERGIGSFLLQTVESEARENGLQEMVIIVPELKCFPGHPDDVSQWLLERGYRAVKPILTNHFCMYGNKCDGFKFASSLIGERNA